MKRFYECTFIVNPGLDDAQIESTVKTAEDTIVKNGGEIVNTEHIGRRRLAYPIAKKHNGFYVSMEFTAEGRIVEKVERYLKLDENVMRFLTLTLDDRELEAKRTRLAFAAQERVRGKESPRGDKGDKKEKTAEKKEGEATEKKEGEAAEKKEGEAAGKKEGEAAGKKEGEAAGKKEGEAAEKKEGEKSESGEAESEKKEEAAAEEAVGEKTEETDESSEKKEDSKQ